MSQFEIRVSTLSGPVESAQSVGRVVRLSRNVRQPDYIPANACAGQKAEPRPGAGEERLAMTKHDGMDVESILINQTKVGQAPCQVWSGYVDLPFQLSLQPADHHLEVILDECGVGSDRLQRARHNPLPLAPPHRREVAVLRVPITKIILPITTDPVPSTN